MREHKVIAYSNPAFNLTAAYGAALVNTGVNPTVANGVPCARLDLDTVTLQLSSIAGGAAKVQIKFTIDPNGDYPVGPASVEEDIVFGETTATDGSVSFKGGFIIQGTGPTGCAVDARGDVQLYLWAKTDAGTATVDYTLITSRN